MAHKDADLRKIKELIKIMTDNELVEVEIKHGDDKIFLKRSHGQQVVNQVPVMRIDSGSAAVGAQTPEISSQPTAAQPSPGAENLAEIKSPIVGTFYATPSPDSDRSRRGGRPADGRLHNRGDESAQRNQGGDERDDCRSAREQRPGSRIRPAPFQSQTGLEIDN